MRWASHSPRILPEVVKAVVAESQGQFVFASHSPLLVDFFAQEAIHMLAKRENGSVAVCSFGEVGDFGGGQEYYGPGELWSMSGHKDLESAVVRQSGSGEREQRGARSFSKEAARRFVNQRAKPRMIRVLLCGEGRHDVGESALDGTPVSEGWL